MKSILMKDANKLHSNRSEYEAHQRMIEKATYRRISLDYEKFRNLVFMGTNATVWHQNQDLVDKLTPEGKSRTLGDVVDRIIEEYRHSPDDLPLQIFKRLSDDEPWFKESFTMSARFDPRLLGELKIRPLDTADSEEKNISPSGSYYLEDGNHRALVYLLFLRLGVIKVYDSVQAIISDHWEHIFPWQTMPSRYKQNN